MQQPCALALTFCGDGAYYPGVMDQLAAGPQAVKRVLDELDAEAQQLGVARPSSLLGKLRSTAELATQAPDLLLVASYTACMASYEALITNGVTPAVALGHGVGEIAALAAAGALTYAEGMKAVCLRTEAIRRGGVTGAMLELHCEPQRAAGMVSVLAHNNVSVAAINSPSRVVMSGATEGIEQLARLAAALDVRCERLPFPFALFSPHGMHHACTILASTLQSLKTAPLRFPAYSPSLARYYQDNDSLGSCIAEALVLPVRYDEALAKLAAAGIMIYVECGPSSTLSTAARDTLPSSTHALPLLLQGIPLEQRIAVVKRRLLLLGDREGVAPEVRGIFSEHLKYPAEAFADDTDLEDALAIEPAQKRETIRKVQEAFGLDPLPMAVELSNYHTFGSLLDLIHKQWQVLSHERPQDASVEEVETPLLPPLDRDEIRRFLVTDLTRRLNYPVAAFAEDAVLSADLAIDAEMQNDVLATATKHFNLPPWPLTLQLRDYPSFGAFVDLIHRRSAMRTTHELPPSAPSATTEATANAPQIEAQAALQPAQAPAPEQLARAGLPAALLPVALPLAGRSALVVSPDAVAATEAVDQLTACGAKVLLLIWDGSGVYTLDVAGSTPTSEAPRIAADSVFLPHAMSRVVEEVAARLQDVDMVVNVASLCENRPDAAQPGPAPLRLSLDASTLSCYWGTVLAARILKPHSGSVLNLFGMADAETSLHSLVKRVSVSAVEALTRHLAAQLGAVDVRVNSVVLSGANSEEMTEVLRFLTSARSRTISGQTIVTS